MLITKTNAHEITKKIPSQYNVERKRYKNCIPINIISHEMLAKRNINSKNKTWIFIAGWW